MAEPPGDVQNRVQRGNGEVRFEILALWFRLEMVGNVDSSRKGGQIRSARAPGGRGEKTTSDGALRARSAPAQSRDRVLASFSSATTQ
jgi:hypothetical protein